MKRSTDRILTTHVGHCLRRPAWKVSERIMRRAFAKRAHGP